MQELRHRGQEQAGHCQHGGPLGQVEAGYPLLSAGKSQVHDPDLAGRRLPRSPVQAACRGRREHRPGEFPDGAGRAFRPPPALPRNCGPTPDLQPHIFHLVVLHGAIGDTLQGRAVPLRHGEATFSGQEIGQGAGLRRHLVLQIVVICPPQQGAENRDRKGREGHVGGEHAGAEALA